MGNVVSIQIQVDDQGSPAIIAKSEQALTSLGTAAEATKKRIATAGSEMQQMLDNIDAAQKKFGTQTNAWQGPISELGNSFATLGTAAGEMDNLGMAFAQMPSRIAPAADAVRGFGQSATGHLTTSLDAVRLISQEFGFRLPRALESMLSRMPAVANVLGGLVSGFALIAAAEVFVRVGEEAYEFYNKIFDVNKEVAKYNEQAGKAANTRLFDDASLETSVDLLREANAQIDQLEKKRVAAGADKPGGGLMQYVRQIGLYAGAAYAGDASQQMAVVRDANNAPIFNGKDDADLAQAYANRAIAQGRSNQTGRQYSEEEMRNRQAAQQQALQGINQISAAQANAHALNKQRQEDELAHERDLVVETQRLRDAQLKAGIKADDPKLTQVHVIDPNAGADERRIADAKADEDAAAKTTDFMRKERDARIAAQNEAVNAGLEGEARFAAQRAQIEDGLVRKYHDGELTMAGYRAMRAATELKFDNEAKQRLDELTAQSQKQADSAAAGGMSGAGRILAEQKAQLDDIDRAQQKFTGGKPATPQVQADFDKERAAVATETNQKLTELETEFTDRVAELVARRTDAALGGYAKIDAAADRQVQQLQQSYDKDFANAQLSDQKKEQAAATLAAGISAIDAAAAQQKTELAAKNRAEDLQYDQEAAQAEMRVRSQGISGWSSTYRNAVAEIELQEQQRLAKLQANAVQEGLTEQEIAERKVDIERSANAEIASQNQQLQHQIAGTLQSAFTDPVGFIKQKMEQMMFEIIAAWVMRLGIFKNVFGSTLGGLQPGAAAGAPGAAAQGPGGFLAQALHLGHTVPGVTSQASLGTPGFGTGGVIAGGTMLPQGYNSTQPESAPVLRTSSTASVAALPSGSSEGSTSRTSSGTSIPDTISSTATDAVTLARTYGIRLPGASGGSDASTGAGSSASSSSASLSRMLGIKMPGMPGTTDSTGGYSASGYDASGNPTDSPDAGDAGPVAPTGSPTGASGASTALNIGGAAMAAYGGGKGVYESFFQPGAKGALDGTISGAEAGAAIGSFAGPVGTLLGGAIGGAIGLGVNLAGDITGEGSRLDARAYYNKTILPQLDKLDKNPGADYLTAESQVNKVSSDGDVYMQSKYGMDAAAWVKSTYLDKETARVDADISRMARGGSEYTGAAAMEFHTGGEISGFGDFGTSSDEGFIHAQLGEGIVMQRAMQSGHAPMVQAMNSGADPASVAAMYMKAAGSSSGGAGSPVTNNHTHNYSMLDAKGFRRMLDSGGITEINAAQNRHVANYSGDSIG